MGTQEKTNGESVELWPTQYLELPPASASPTNEVALIILNSPMSDFEYFQRLYHHASLRICADGGANRLYDLVCSHYPKGPSTDALRSVAPDLIHGDLDSLAQNVRKVYEGIGVEVSQDPDQYSTDFGKAIKIIVKRLPKVREILVLGSIGGRVDQGLGLLHELYREQVHRHPEVRFWLFTESSVSTLLRPGTSLLHTPLSEGLIKRNVGILPVYGPAIISTQGLEWDVQDWPTEMGSQVSTSNHIFEDCISIKTDRDILFTVERVIGH